MVNRSAKKRGAARPQAGWGRILVVSIPGVLLFFLLIYFIFPQFGGAKKKQEPSTGPRKELDPLEQGSDDDQPWLVAEQALDALYEHVREFDQNALRFARDRARGTYGNGNERLLKYWQKWADSFKERVRTTASEYDIFVRDEGGDLPTPVHVAYQALLKMPFEIRLTWENGRSIEGLPARLSLDIALKAAGKWIESGGK